MCFAPRKAENNFQNLLRMNWLHNMTGTTNSMLAPPERAWGTMVGGVVDTIIEKFSWSRPFLDKEKKVIKCTHWPQPIKLIEIPFFWSLPLLSSTTEDSNDELLRPMLYVWSKSGSAMFSLVSQAMTLYDIIWLMTFFVTITGWRISVTNSHNIFLFR